MFKMPSTRGTATLQLTHTFSSSSRQFPFISFPCLKTEEKFSKIWKYLRQIYIKFNNITANHNLQINLKKKTPNQKCLSTRRLQTRSLFGFGKILPIIEYFKTYGPIVPAHVNSSGTGYANLDGY